MSLIPEVVDLLVELKLKSYKLEFFLCDIELYAKQQDNLNYSLAYLLHILVDIRIDQTKKNKIFSFLQSQESSEYLYWTGMVFYCKIGIWKYVLPQTLEPIKYFEKSFQLGNSLAALKLGHLHYPIDKKKAKYYYKSAVEMGNLHGFIFLADLTKNKNTKIELLHKAEKMGCTRAKLYLANLNKSLALKYWMEAKELGCNKATQELGDHYFYEEDNNQLAIKYYQESIDNGNIYAVIDLAHVYQYLEEEPQKIINLLQRGANFEEPDCMFELAKYYKDIHLYKESAILGNEDAMITLAEMYVNTHPQKAYYLLRRAVDDENSNEAKLKLAYLYSNGIGCQPNLEKAEKLIAEYFKIYGPSPG